MASATFDGDSLIITLPALVDGVLDFEIERDLYSAWKVWFKTGDNAKYPLALRTDGGAPLTPGITQGAYFFIQNQNGWRIKPFENDGTYFAAGNLAPEDSSIPILIPTDGNFSVLVAGLQPITQSVESILTQQQSSAFRGEVHIDTVNGRAGQAWPIGTDFDASNNVVDGVAIAEREGFRRLKLFGEITLVRDLVGWAIEGATSKQEACIHLGGYDVDKTRFVNLSIDGTGTGDILGENLIILNLSGVSGTIKESGINSFFAPSGNSKTTIKSCWSDVPGVATAVFDLSDMSDADFQLRAWSGGAEIRNVDVVGQNVSIDLISGHIVLDSTCELGTIVLRGIGKLTNNSTNGLTLDLDGFVDARDIQLLRGIQEGRWLRDEGASTITVYHKDTGALLVTFNALDENGSPSGLGNVFELVPV